jgi:hypothetical protein
MMQMRAALRCADDSLVKQLHCAACKAKTVLPANRLSTESGAQGRCERL